MKCKSCSEEIPPKFAHAFTVNICPLCGDEILDIRLKNILAELKVALNDAKDYMDEVDGWLYSNFGLKKLKPNDVVIDKDALAALEQKSISMQMQHKNLPGPHNPGVVVNRREDGQSEEDVVVDEKPSTVFAKRAGVLHAKSALDFIKGKASFGAADPSEFHGVDDEYGDEDMVEENANPLSANEKNQMASLFKGNDMSSGSQELEMQKLKKLQAQSAVTGGSGGLFRRG